jgi:hypothetical protein
VSSHCPGLNFNNPPSSFHLLPPSPSSLPQDPFINTYPTVIKTIYQIFAVTALRIHSYMRDCNQLNRISITHNVTFLTMCISEAIKYGAILVRKYQWKSVDDSTSESGTTASSFLLRDRIFPLAEVLSLIQLLTLAVTITLLCSPNGLDTMPSSLSSGKGRRCTFLL